MCWKSVDVRSMAAGLRAVVERDMSVLMIEGLG